MLIHCPSCESAYLIEAGALGPTGRSVRCVRCRTVWFAIPDADIPVQETGESEFMPLPRRAMAERCTAPLHDPLTEYVPARDPLLGPRAEPPTAIMIPPGEAPLILTAKGEIKTAAIRTPRRREPRRWPRPGLRAAAFALVAVAGALTLARADVVRVAPQTATLYAAIGLPVNLRGLAFENVTSTKERRDGVTVLVVEGTIVSVSASAVELPRLRIALRGDAGNEVYAWTADPNSPTLAPGEKLPFRTRLASPPPEGRDVLVRFEHWRDGEAIAQKSFSRRSM